MGAQLLITEARCEEVNASVQMKAKRKYEDLYTAELTSLEKAAAQRLEAAKLEAHRQVVLAADEARSARTVLETQLAQAKAEYDEVAAEATTCRNHNMEQSAKIQSE